jgi:hypothetical protein
MATIYHNTTDISGEELKQRIERCKGQNKQFLELFRIFHNMTKWEARRQYIQHCRHIDEIQPQRAINALCKQGHIYKSTEKWKEERGAENFVYKLFPTDGSFPEDFNMNSLDKIYTVVIFNDGVLDEEATRQSFEKKLAKKVKEYQQEMIEEATLPTNTIDLEYYLHDLFLKANSKLTTTNIGPRVGRYLNELRTDGILLSYEYQRDGDNKLKTIVTVGSEPTQISTFKDKMNEIYLQEKKWSKMKD